jgi:hypothetical protein
VDVLLFTVKFLYRDSEKLGPANLRAKLMARWLCPRVLGLTRFDDDEDLVAEILGHQPDRDPSKGMPDEVLDSRFRDVERHNRNLAPALT